MNPMRQKMKSLARMLLSASRAVARSDGAGVHCYLNVAVAPDDPGQTMGLYSAAILGDVFRGLIEDARKHTRDGNCAGCDAVMAALEAANAAFEASVAASPVLRGGKRHVH